MRLVHSFRATSNCDYLVACRLLGSTELTRGMISAGCVVSLCANSSL